MLLALPLARSGAPVVATAGAYQRSWGRANVAAEPRPSVLHFGVAVADAEHVVVRQHFQPLCLFGGERVDLLLLRSRCVDGLRDVYNLEGGFDAYSALDDSVPRC